MYLLGSFSRSTSTTPLHTKSTVGGLMTVLSPQFQPHHTHQTHQTHQTYQESCRHTRHHHTRPTRPTRPTAASVSNESAESIFLQALARASLCRKHARPHSTHSRPHSLSNERPLKSHKPNTHRKITTNHHRDHTAVQPFSTSHDRNHTAAQPVSAIPREELRGLVDLYDYEHEQWPQHNTEQKRTALPVPVEDLPSETRQSDKDTHHHHSVEPPQPTRDPPSDAKEYEAHVKHIVRLLKSADTPHDDIFDHYLALPHPRISYLSDIHIRKLMRHFSIVEFRTEQSMLRYLSLVDDMTAANIPLVVDEWNSAIAYAGRWARRVTDLQVETATQIWLRMEQEAGVKSDNVTFNILFDVAAKAGKFALAEVIMKEMIARDLPENRFFRTNKIYYYGLKRDGSAVRRAYKELVDAGEFVDTAVLNCVIASLIRAGEASAAEHIFERMKAMHSDKTASKPKPRGWRKQRELGRVLDKAARALRNHPEGRPAVQDATPITPNMHTYRLLVKYHTHESGNIDRVTDLLDEMHDMQMRIHGSVFVHLFRGFQLHGGVRYSSWTKPRLEKLWAVFLEFVKETNEYNLAHPGILDEEDKGCYYSTGVVVAVLRAFNKIAGQEATMEIWHDILDEWNPEGEALDAVKGVLAGMFAYSGE